MTNYTRYFLSLKYNIIYYIKFQFFIFERNFVFSNFVICCVSNCAIFSCDENYSTECSIWEWQLSQRHKYYICVSYAVRKSHYKKKRREREMVDGIKDLYRNCCRNFQSYADNSIAKNSELSLHSSRERTMRARAQSHSYKSCSSGSYMPGFYPSCSTSVAYKKIWPADEVWTALFDDRQACANALD